MTDTISHQPQQQQQQQAKAQTSSTSTAPSTASSGSASSDINARRDAASMMMSMSQLMDAAALHAQAQQQQSVGGMVNAANSHLNHTSRGPHKKRTASSASLENDLMNGRRPVAAHHGHHLINGGGILRMPVTGNATATTASSAVSAATSSTDVSISSVGKGKASASSSGNKTNGASANVPLTEEEKKAERRAANRRSAFQSRQRRKILIEDLQRTVAALSKDNNDLRKTNDEIRSQLEAALLENRQLRQITNSLSVQAHAQQQAQQVVAAQQQVPQSQQQVAQAPSNSGSPKLSAQQTPSVPTLPPPPPSVAVAPAPPTIPQPPAFNPAALTNFLTTFSSQAAAAGTSPVDQQHIFNAKIALMAAQSRVSELEHHQAVSQAQAAANAAVAQQQQHAQQLQAQAQAAASAALGLAHVAHQAPATGNLPGRSDNQHLARLQELLSRGIGGMNGPATSSASQQPAPATTAPSAPGNNAAGVDLTHLRSLLEAQQQQQQQNMASQAPGSPSTSAAKQEAHEQGKSHSENAAMIANVPNEARSVTNPAIVTPPSPAGAATGASPLTGLSIAAGQDAPGIQLLIKSLRAGQGGTSGSAPLDDAVRNFLKQQQAQIAQQQQTNSSTTASIKAESK
ncbi:unnamed protein product [Pseudo-nitzschia multistriata]|uniref:BZIP domain-containing protein n=1 Tax=Pseudo-nitzschia multistriata TaxID=183589 RepID=A0A448ZEK8_9STRA|nr:unnamed protein product [Pseudo-nitzschia multistriata]